MSKTAIVILADPATQAAEALGRLFNALVLAHGLRERKQEVTVIFHGAGTRWAEVLVRADHPAHALFTSVGDLIGGVCGGCADVFGATAGATASGARLRRELAIPGTGGMIDLAGYIADGYQLVIF
jgi:hypothetical protein